MTNHRFYVMAPLDAVDWVEDMFRQLVDENQDGNCERPLHDAQGNIVARCCSFVVGQETYDILKQIIDAEEYPAGIVFVICDALGDNRKIVRETNWPDQSVIGLEWHMASTLERVGLSFSEQ